MKQFRSTLILLIIAIAFGGYLYLRERGPATETGHAALLRLDSNKVAKITIKQSNSTLSLIKSGDEWQIKEDAEKDEKSAPADPDTVKNLLDSLELVQSNSIVSAPGKLSEYGLEKATDSISVDGTSITFGNSPEFSSGNIYAQIKNGKNTTIALIPNALHDNAFKSFFEWRDKKVLRFDEDKLTQLQIDAPDIKATFVANNKGNDDEETQWDISQPTKARANSSAVKSFISSLENARIIDFIDDAKDEQELDKPQTIVKITTDKKTQTLSIGKAVDKGYFAHSTSPESNFILPSDIYELINRPLTEWRDKKVLLLDTAKVTEMRISARGKSVTLTHSHSDWTASNPKLDKTVISNAATDFLVGVQGLRAEDFIDSPKNAADYGLNEPVLEIALSSSEWTGVKVIRFSNHSNKNYAQLQSADIGKDTIYVMPQDVFGAFSGTLDKLFGK